MPVFDYKCENCGEIFEELVVSSTTPDSEVKCPFCGEHKSKKMISAPSIGRSSGSDASCPTGTCPLG